MLMERLNSAEWSTITSQKKAEDERTDLLNIPMTETKEDLGNKWIQREKLEDIEDREIAEIGEMTPIVIAEITGERKKEKDNTETDPDRTEIEREIGTTERRKEITEIGNETPETGTEMKGNVIMWTTQAEILKSMLRLLDMATVQASVKKMLFRQCLHDSSRADGIRQS
jgi:hypothetical protein